MPERPSIELPDSYSALPFETIKLSHHPAEAPAPTPILIVTLNRPKAYNAFNFVMQAELEKAFYLADVDDRVKVVVITGSGKMYCAGADLAGPSKAFTRDTKIRVPDTRDGGGQVALSIHNCRKPVIGAINGSAVGIGITMTLPMTIRISCVQAKIGFVFSRRALVMEACSSFFLPRLIGYARALHLVTTGSTYQADNKLLDGLFSEVLDKPEKVLPRALEIAEDVSKNCSNVSMALMKDMIWRNPGSAEGTHLLDSKIMWELFGTKDNDEGVKSFMEKRPVNFTGSVADDAPSTYPWWEPINTVTRAFAAPKGSKL
ncbi:ClpP/crotonase [Aulographum hederae CBS 113979]|uniref:ClpP/crotonase n=1 Tax=Aulographum hederae CBS 113979 TaxID=1176131 RepID=A0A6G1GSK6_9PEZI|nr:ClpP/crotonase [Aulographum hederae CBS 113979]